MKKVLILCTGNSARSIMAEALINQQLRGRCGIEAQSAGISPKGSVDPHALQAIAEDGIETGHLRSKGLESLPALDFDLVVTVCDNIKEQCPLLPAAKKTIHIGFEDPDGKPFEAYERTLHQLKNLLIPRIREELCQD